MHSRSVRPMVALAAAVSLLVASPALGAGLPSPSGASSGSWFEGLDTGVCFDSDADGRIDFSVPARIVPCDGPHNNQVAGLVSLGDDTFPTEDLGPLVGPMCSPAYEAFLGRPVEESGLLTSQTWPDAADWALGTHDIRCLLFSFEPIVGTLASGNLVASGETLALYYQPANVSELWLADAGTGQLVRNVAPDVTSLILGSPDWAPDGSALAVTVGVGGEDVDALLVPLDGTVPTVLVTGPNKQDGANISPDGETLAYISNDGLPEYDIFTRPLAGGASASLTDHDGRDASPQWSPDGTLLLFRRATDGVSDIWVMDADGGNQVRLTDNGASNYDPRWSPDGTQVLFSTNLGGDYDIWAMNADGSDQRALTDHPADDEYPTWSRDGSMIAFQSSRYGNPTIWLMNADGTDASLLIPEQPVGYPMFAPVPVE